MVRSAWLTTHKLGNDPVEDDLVVVALASEANKVLDRLWGLIRIQVDGNVSLGGVNDGPPCQRSRETGGRSRDGEFVPRWFLVEDISVPGLFTAA